MPEIMTNHGKYSITLPLRNCSLPDGTTATLIKETTHPEIKNQVSEK